MSKRSPLAKAAIWLASIIVGLAICCGCFIFGFKVGAWAQYEYDRQIMQQYFRGQPEKDSTIWATNVSSPD